jgi:hypothetical protein
MFFKVLGEAGLQNPESRRIVHLREGHMDIDNHFADWKVKGMKCSSLSPPKIVICKIAK